MRFALEYCYSDRPCLLESLCHFDQCELDAVWYEPRAQTEQDHTNLGIAESRRVTLFGSHAMFGRKPSAHGSAEIGYANRRVCSLKSVKAPEARQGTSILSYSAGVAPDRGRVKARCS